MTILNNIEIDHIFTIPDKTKLAIQNNDPIDDTLHVVCVISNPCLYATRYILAREFIKRMESESNIILYVCELLYEDQAQTKYYVTEKGNPRHLQIKTKTPLWHKENMINVTVNKLLPEDWKAMAWIDADILFESGSWALDALKLLNGQYDILQLFSHCVDMDKKEDTMHIFQSFGYKYSTGRKYVKCGLDFWHPGYAWACTKKAFLKMGGLYDCGILGAGDHNMSFSIINNPKASITQDVSPDYIDSVLQYATRVNTLRLGYVPGVIRHYFHGSKKNRKYMERRQILVKHQYSPYKHMIRDSNGILQPSEKCPPELLSDILNYFKERNEDEFA
jgi:hypothetical protein